MTTTTSRDQTGNGVLYLLSGTSYAARLVVSLYSLRRHYAGPVAVIAADDAAVTIVKRLATDRLLNIDHIPLPQPIGRGRKASYLFKPQLHTVTPFHKTVYLDCDTLVVGRIEELFDLPDDDHLIATQFCDWVTTGRTIAKRIRAWTDTHPELVGPALAFGPAINTGVFAFTPHSKVFERWREVAFAGKRHFIPDELSLQLLLPHSPHRVLDGRFNCSSRYGRWKDRDVRIIHSHGHKHLRPNFPLWRNCYDIAASMNLGGLRDWAPAGDRALAAYFKQQTNSEILTPDS